MYLLLLCLYLYLSLLLTLFSYRALASELGWFVILVLYLSDIPLASHTEGICRSLRNSSLLTYYGSLTIVRLLTALLPFLRCDFWPLFPITVYHRFKWVWLWFCKLEVCFQNLALTNDSLANWCLLFWLQFTQFVCRCITPK